MESQSTPQQPAAPKDGVPPELIQELHEANEQLGRARQHLDQAIDAEVNSLDQRDQAAHEVRDAAKKLEEIDEKIGKELHKP